MVRDTVRTVALKHQIITSVLLVIDLTIQDYILMKPRCFDRSECSEREDGLSVTRLS